MYVNTMQYKRAVTQKDPTCLISAWKSTREALVLKYEIFVTLSGRIGYQKQKEWKPAERTLSGGNRFDNKFVHILEA